MEKTKEHKNLNVLLIIDITGSMGNQIEGVKAMITSYFENYAHSQENIYFHIMTYTESSSGSYVSHYSSSDKEHLIKYVMNIKLSVPPDHPGMSAGGDDGPENLLLALGTICKKIHPHSPILSFVITDASPHYGSTDSPTAKKEREMLTSLGYETLETKFDAYNILNQILNIHDGKIMIIPILYGVNEHFFFQMAFLTGGVVIKPNSNTSKILAEGLSSIIHGVSQTIGANHPAEITEQMTSHIKCFLFYHVPNLQILEKETQDRINMEPETINNEKALMGLFKTVLTIEGRKFEKRLTSVSIEQIIYSVRLVARISKTILKKDKNDKDMNTIFELVDKVSEIIEPADAINLKNHFKEIIPKIMDEKQIESFKKEENSSISIISLETIREAVDFLPKQKEVDPTKWLPSIMKLMHVKLIKVNLPLDSSGNPDFMDSWSSIIQKFGPSVMTAYDAMLIRDKDGMYKDPLDSELYNACLIFVQPGDNFGAFIFEILSDLNLHDLVTTYLISGKSQIFRNIWAGLVASLLYNLIKKKNKSSTDEELIHTLLFSIKNHYRKIASTVIKNLEEEKHLNPADAIPKLMAAIIWFFAKNHHIKKSHVINILKDLLEEWTCGVIMKFNNQEKNKSFDPIDSFSFIKEKPENITGKDLLKKQHPLEILPDLEKGNIEDFETIENDNAILVDNWKELIKTIKHPLENKLLIGWNYFKKLLKIEESASEINFEEIFLESLLMEKRKNRYKLLDDLTHEKKTFVESLKILLIKKIKNDLSKNLIDLRKRRDDFVKNILIKKVLTFKGTYEECNNLLEKNIIILFTDKKFKLNRMEVLDIINQISDEAQLSTLGKALIFGDWTKEPSGQLFKHKSELMDKFSFSEEIKSLLEKSLVKKLPCTRKEGSNRHGYSYFLQKRLLIDYDDEYGSKIVENKIKRKPYVEKMKEWKIFADDFIKKYNDKSYSYLIESVIYSQEDANNLELIKKYLMALIKYIENPEINMSIKEEFFKYVEKYGTKKIKKVLKRKSSEKFGFSLK